MSSTYIPEITAMLTAVDAGDSKARSSAYDALRAIDPVLAETVSDAVNTAETPSFEFGGITRDQYLMQEASEKQVLHLLFTDGAADNALVVQRLEARIAAASSSLAKAKNERNFTQVGVYSLLLETLTEIRSGRA